MRKIAFLFLIGLSLAVCGSAQEDVPQAAPEPAPEPECTIESLGNDAFTDLATEEERQGSAANMNTLLAQMEQFGTVLQEQADLIPLPPKALPAFPAIQLELVTHTSTRVAKRQGNQCVPTMDVQEHKHGISFLCLPGWSCAAALFKMGFDELAMEDRSDGQTTLDRKIYHQFFLRGLSGIPPIQEFVTEASDLKINQILKQVFEDERLTKVFMEWTLAWLPDTLASHKPLAERTLTTLWEASNTTADRESDGTNLEDAFTRVQNRDAKQWQQEVIYLRYWIMRLAHAFNMHDAYTWGGDLVPELRDSGLAYEKMYRSFIKDMLRQP